MIPIIYRNITAVKRRSQKKAGIFLSKFNQPEGHSTGNRGPVIVKTVYFTRTKMRKNNEMQTLRQGTESIEAFIVSSLRTAQHL
jgi:hypothetical protein